MKTAEIRWAEEPLRNLKRGAVVRGKEDAFGIYAGNSMVAAFEGPVRIKDWVAKYPRLNTFGRNGEALVIPYMAERAEVATGQWATLGDFRCAISGEDTPSLAEFVRYFKANAGNFDLYIINQNTIME